ncbi:hypothetical protein JA9_000241 [Meyerozyma sp. JA9]|nr:hypothetical protein JA9_000241 [Meyerozyma sp. JA9]
MLNRKLNKKLNLSLAKGLQEPGPYTPLDQTLKTPVDAPNNGNYFPGAVPGVTVTPGVTPAVSGANGHAATGANAMYSHYNESDDMLMDEDTSRMRNYTVTFTPQFDSLVLSIYSQIMAHPTTTPFSGMVPPSGLVSKVSNETMNVLMRTTAKPNHPMYDGSGIVNNDHLRSAAYQPVFLQLFRKRFLDLCTAQGNKEPHKVPASTTVSICGSVPMGRQSSISSLSLNELNIGSSSQNQNQNQALPGSRSRSTSLSLRKQSLTRNNSHSGGSNWLHVGNLNNIRGHAPHEMTTSTDSLQSMQDYVPQSLIARSGTGPNSANGSNGSASGPASAGFGASTSLTPNGSSSGFHAMMMDYQTPPSSHKGSVSSEYTPPSSASSSASGQFGAHTPQLVSTGLSGDFDELSLHQPRSMSHNFPRPLTINTESANQHGFNGQSGTLDSPFMSATTPSEEVGYFMHGSSGFPSFLGVSPQAGPQAGPQAEEPKKDVNLPANVSLSEKKRDSLKLKRGIH